MIETTNCKKKWKQLLSKKFVKQRTITIPLEPCKHTTVHNCDCNQILVAIRTKVATIYGSCPTCETKLDALVQFTTKIWVL